MYQNETARSTLSKYEKQIWSFHAKLIFYVSVLKKTSIFVLAVAVKILLRKIYKQFK